MSNKGFKGFTLAEVLITLGVIGIVAAMTMPILTAKYNKRITEVRLKKFYSVMNQAIQRAKVDYGDMANWNYTVDNVYNNSIIGTDYDRLINQHDKIDANFREYFGKYIEFVDVKPMEINGKVANLYYFKDGSAVTHRWFNSYDYEFFPKNPEKCLKLNGNERLGTCSFAFQFYINTPGRKFYNTFAPYNNALSEDDYNNKNKLYNDSLSGCSNGENVSGNFCGLIIMLNNWQVPDDYPRKLAY